MSLDLAELGNIDSMMASTEKDATNGEPLALALNAIREDPDQPRRVFDEGAHAELTASVQARGIRTPISVRPHPDEEGAYIINHGARRYRAAAAAGLETIPAFVDGEHGPLDQLAENIQREALMLPDIIDGIGRLLDSGMTQVAISKELGKQTTWVSRIARLRKLPEELRALVDDDLCRDSQALVLLLRAWDKDAEFTSDWISARGDEDAPITRHAADGLLSSLTDDGESGDAVGSGETLQEGDGSEPPVGDPDGAGTLSGGGDSAEDDVEDSESADMSAAPRTAKPKPRLDVTVDGRAAIVLLTEFPKYGLFRVEYEDGSRDTVAADAVTLVALVDYAGSKP